MKALAATPSLAILLEGTELPVGHLMIARVGSKGMTWEEKGQNDGATSEEADATGEIKLAWLVYNTLNREGEQELTVRVYSKKSLMVGRELVGEMKIEAKENIKKKVKIVDFWINVTMGAQSKVLADGPEPVARTHPCGTNHFGQLPESMEELTPQDLKNCMLWGEAHEPMKNWIACHFIYQKQAFKQGPMLVKSPTPPFPKVKDYKDHFVHCSPAGAKSGYGITQPPDRLISNSVPMLEISMEGEKKSMVIQDGVIINYLVIPVLYPQKATESVMAWERKIGYEFIPAMWREFDGKDYINIFRRTLCNYPATFKSYLNPAMRKPLFAGRRLMNREMRRIKNYIGKEFDSGKTMKDIFNEFKSDMGDKDFMGGSEPNPTDVSFYGINIIRYVTDVGPNRRLMEEFGLKPWMERMMKIIPPSECLKMDYFGPSMEGWKGGWLCDPPQFDPVKLESSGAPSSKEEDDI